MRRLLTLPLACALLLGTAFGQDVTPADYNVELLADVPLQSGEDGNDVWGYVDGEGREYALMGSTQATYIYDLADPSAPALVARIAGASSIWRDIKSYGERLYVVADQGADGLLVIDMANAPDTVTHTFYKPAVTVGGATATLTKAHNLYIDPQGRLVLAGSNLYNGAPLVFDLAADPVEPPFVGAARQEYAHDVYVNDDILYSSDIYRGTLGVHDMSDPADIRLLGTATTSGTFTHNAWSTDDNATAFTTDEKNAASVDAYDVSDPTDIRRLDRFRPRERANTQSIPHNTHVLGDHLATSWYKDGVILTDATRPHNLVEVGRYDTRPSAAGGGFEGCWGAYPFLPSGLLLVSDIESGLFVLRPTYVRAAYAEGTVVNASTGFALGNVEVAFADEPTVNAVTDISGDYATGIAAPGIYRLTFTKEGYSAETVSVVLTAGRVDERTVELYPLRRDSIEVRVVDEAGAPLPDAQVARTLVREVREANGTSTNRYDIIAGRFGYQTVLRRDVSASATDSVTRVEIPLPQGYYDDFTFDFGWHLVDSALSGNWVRAIPRGTVSDGVQAQLDTDATFDYGDYALVTGNAEGDVGADDVDDGTTTIRSPALDLSGTPGARVEFSYYFFAGLGSAPSDDELVVTITNGTETVTLLTVTETTDGWQRFEGEPLADKLTLTDSMYVEVSTADAAGSGNVVEAGFDWFVVTARARPEVTFLPEVGCAPLTVEVRAEDADTVGFAYDFAGGTPERVNGAVGTVVFERAGTYDAVLRAPDGQGGTATFVYPNAIRVEANVTADFATLIVGDTVYFENTSEGINRATWDFGDGDTSTTLFASHVYSGEGPFVVTLTVIGTCGTADTSQTVTLNPVGTDERPVPRSFTLTRNPVREELGVRYAGAQPTTFSLHNAVGQVVASQAVSGAGAVTMSVAHLGQGVYYLQAAGLGQAALPVLIVR